MGTTCTEGAARHAVTKCRESWHTSACGPTGARCPHGGLRPLQHFMYTGDVHAGAGGAPARARNVHSSGSHSSSVFTQPAKPLKRGACAPAPAAASCASSLTAELAMRCARGLCCADCDGANAAPLAEAGERKAWLCALWCGGAKKVAAGTLVCGAPTPSLPASVSSSCIIRQHVCDV